MEWSSQQFFKLDEQLRKLRAQLEDITWKLDTWERGLPTTNKVRFETKQYLEIVNSASRQFLSTIEVVKSQTFPPAPRELIRETIKDKEADNSTTLFNDTRNQADSQQATGKPTDVLENSSNLDLRALNQPSEAVGEESERIEQELELMESQLPGIEAFKFFERQPFRTVEINERSYVQAESVFVAVCLVLMDWMNANDRPKLQKIKEEFISSDCSWVDGNKSLPAEQSTLTGDICKKVFLQYLSKLDSSSTNEVLEEYDIGYVLEATIRQYLLMHSKEINPEYLRDFSVALPQIQVLVELTSPDLILSGLEINDLQEGHEVTVIIGDSQCKLLTDLGSNSCFIEI